MIELNGEQKKISEGQSVASLLKELNINPGSVVVELNLKILERQVYETTILKDKDKVEVLSFVGGG